MEGICNLTAGQCFTPMSRVAEVCSSNATWSASLISRSLIPVDVSSPLLRDLYLVLFTVASTYVAVCVYEYRQRRIIERIESPRPTTALRGLSKGRTIARGLHKGWLAADIIPLAKRSTDQEKVSVKDMACIQGVNASGNFLSAIMDMMWNHVNIVRER